jgi:hypothetical protein
MWSQITDRRALGGQGWCGFADPRPPHQPFGTRVSDINWNVELRKIEREFNGLPPERSRTQIRLQRIQAIVAKNRLAERLSLMGIWARLGLVAALTLSVFWWPYGRQCGLPLVAFLSANAMVIVGAIALGVRTWRDRMAWVFAGAALCAVIAWTTIALHALPRLGYSPLGGQAAGWSCTVPTPAGQPK